MQLETFRNHSQHPSFYSSSVFTVILQLAFFSDTEAVLYFKCQHLPLNILSIDTASCKDGMRISGNLGFKDFFFSSQCMKFGLFILYAFWKKKYK